MKTFHLDFNTTLFRPEYIVRWLHELAELGFDTLLWEVENAFEWRSCPECAVPDTLPIAELKHLLKVARELGFENIPLFQTLGHCEYVLKSERYAHLRENDCIDQYCPTNPAVIPFLIPWIEEYLEVFDSPKYFHVGADETMQLGACPTCKAHVAEHGIADLYRGHMDRIIEIVHAQGSRPLLWADMFLSHPESLQGLSRDILLCDWAYERDDDATEVFLFEHGKFSVESAPDSAINAFGDRLYRAGSNRRQLNPWVVAEHLAAAGFDLLLCPASSHHGDPVYVARTKMHMRNIGDTLRCAERLNVRGTILTSWTWHLFSWELQRHLIAYYSEVANGPQRSHDTFLNAYGQERLGMTAVSFSQICDRLEHPCPLLDVNQLGFFKGCIHRKSDPVGDLILGLKRDGKLKAMCEQAKEASCAFEHAQHLLRTVDVQSEELAAWQLAAESMAARARSAHYLLQRALAESVTEDAQALVAREEALRARQLSEFLKNVLPHRAEEMVSCQFDRVIQALKS